MIAEARISFPQDRRPRRGPVVSAAEGRHLLHSEVFAQPHEADGVTVAALVDGSVGLEPATSSGRAGWYSSSPRVPRPALKRRPCQG